MSFLRKDRAAESGFDKTQKEVGFIAKRPLYSALDQNQECLQNAFM